jgi:hypothetical protein
VLRLDSGLLLLIMKRVQESGYEMAPRRCSIRRLGVL